MTKVFLDTNIWFYAFVPTQSKPKYQQAIQLLEDTSLDICLSVQVLNELSVNLLKKTNFSEDDLQRLISSFYNHYQVFHLQEQVYLKASEIRKQHNFSYWDSLVIASALLGNCTKVYSEDMQDGFILENTLTIYNPF